MYIPHLRSSLSLPHPIRNPLRLARPLSNFRARSLDRRPGRERWRADGLDPQTDRRTEGRMSLSICNCSSRVSILLLPHPASICLICDSRLGERWSGHRIKRGNLASKCCFLSPLNSNSARFHCQVTAQISKYQGLVRKCGQIEIATT